MPEERLCLAAVAVAHGVRGLVKLKTFTERPDDVAAYGPLTDESGARRFTVEVKGAAKGGVIAALEGVGTREEAEALKGLRLYAPRAALPPIEEEETYYQADLVGLRVETQDGETLGVVAAVENHGAGDLLDIRGEDGASLTLPFTKAAVPVVDIAGGRIVAAPPEAVEAKPENEESPANE